MAISNADSSFTGPSRRTNGPSVSHSASSSAQWKRSPPANAPKRNTPATLGWRKAAAARASRKNRSRIASEPCVSITLRATLRCKVFSVARKVTPIPPRPNSQSDPSSRRSISKSSKSAIASGGLGSSESSNPARSRHARQTPFAPSDSPQTEQSMADADPMAASLLLADQNAQEFAQLLVHFGFRVDRAPHLGPKHLA